MTDARGVATLRGFRVTVHRNSVPIVLAPAQLGANQIARLDGSLSYDAEGLAPGYSWRQTAGALVDLRPTTASPIVTFSTPPGDAILVFSLTLTNARAAQATAAKAASVSWTQLGPGGRGGFRSFLPGMGEPPVDLKAAAGYIVQRPSSESKVMRIRGQPWPESSYTLELPPGLNLISLPRSVAATHTTVELLGLTGGRFLAVNPGPTATLPPPAGQHGLRIYLPGQPAATRWAAPGLRQSGHLTALAGGANELDRP